MAKQSQAIDYIAFLEQENARLKAENRRLVESERMSRDSALSAIGCLRAPNRTLLEMYGVLRVELDALMAFVGAE